MRIGIFDPYIDTLGGGERYMMTAASCLVKHGFQVDVFWDDSAFKEKLSDRLHLDLTGVNFVKNIFARGGILEKWVVTKKYDAFIYLSDGSVPFLFSKKNILHFQVPFTNVGGKRLTNKIKFRLINKIICNSRFTKRFIDEEYGIKSQVIYPPVDTQKFRSGKKENLILSVSRFSKTLHAKKQEVLIDAFGNLVQKGLKEWRLVLAGGVRDDEKDYLESLNQKAKNLPIEFYPNLDFYKLQKLYGEAKIFWHAAGFDEEDIHPERMEHFGIVVVEAMSAGCVPVVIGKGGIPEIVENKVNGFLWEKQPDLEKLTLDLIRSSDVLDDLSQKAVVRSKEFNQQVFCQKIYEAVKE